MEPLAAERPATLRQTNPACLPGATHRPITDDDRVDPHPLPDHTTLPPSTARHHPSSRPTSGIVWPALGTLVVAVFVAVSYLPWWRTFIGTDLGVYWEVSRRVWEDGRLIFGGNAWDHKPLGIYLALAPFHLFNTDAHEFLGLKVGTLAVYTAAFAAPTWLLSRAAGGAAWPVRAVCCVLSASLLAAGLSLYGPLDAAQNGILVVSAVSLEVCGLALVWQSVQGTPGRRSVLRGVLAGVCIGSAPFFRPTAIAAGLVLLGLFLIQTLSLLRAHRGHAAIRHSLASSLGAATVSAGLTVLMWLGLTVALGTPLDVLWRVLVAFNAEYGAYYRAHTSVADYLTQCPVCLSSAAAGWIALVWAGATHLRGATRAWGATSRDVAQTGATRDADVHAWVILGAAAYAALCFALGLYARKIQSFYPYQFVLPALFAGGAALALLAGRAPRRAGVFAGLCALAGLSLTFHSLRYCLPVIGGNDVASNQRMATGLIVDALARYNVPDPAQRTLWVQGNRAPLYAQAARVGIAPYDWTVFDTAVYAASDAAFETWIERFRHSPPGFIVRLNNAQSVPWMEPSRVVSRSATIQAVIDTRFEQISVNTSGQNTWPYGYDFTVYRRIDAGIAPASRHP